MTQNLKTKDRHGYSIQFSPFYPNRLACVTGQYYGIAGSGTLFILDVIPDGLAISQHLSWNDGLFDVAWAESNENILVTAAGDGAVLVWDVLQPQGPLKAFKEHTKEVYCIDWSVTRNENLVLSGSWDRLIKLWDITQDKSLETYLGHEYIVYNTSWSPHVPGCFASVSGDKTLRIWDRRKSYMAQIIIPAHNAEILSCDWCKYDQNVIFTGGVDCSIKGWDIRNPRECFCELLGHNYAVRRIKASPFAGDILASCSYDFTVRTWNVRQKNPIETIEHHTEFVYGLDFNLHVPGQIADCGWDELVRVYAPSSLVPTR